MLMPLVLMYVAALPSEYEAVCRVAVLEAETERSSESQRAQNITAQQFLKAKYSILSGENLLAVVTGLELGPELLEDTPAGKVVATIRRKVPWLRSPPPDETRLAELLIDQLQRRVAVILVTRDAIRVSYRGTDDERNAQLVNAIVDRFIVEATRRRLTAGGMTLGVLEEHLAHHRDKLEENHRRLKEFREQHLLDLPKEIETATNTLLQDKDALDEEQRDLEELSSELTAIEEQISSAKKLQPSESTKEMERRVAQMKRNIERKEHQLSEMKATLTEKNPKIMVQEDTIARLREELEAEQSKLLAEETQTSSQAVASLLAQQKELVAQKDGKHARIDALGERIKTNEKRLGDLLADEEQLNELTREYELNLQVYNSYLKRLAASRGDEGTGEQGEAEGYEIVEKAFTTHVPVGPTRGRLISIGTLLCTACGIAVTLMVELISRRSSRPGRTAGSPATTAADLQRRLVKRVVLLAAVVVIVALELAAGLMVSDLL